MHLTLAKPLFAWDCLENSPSQANLPEGRIHSLAYDKAADDNDSHRLLHQAKIRPVIQNRHLWKDQTEQMLPGHDGNSNIVYDEAGTLHCYDRTRLPIVRHPMAYIGFSVRRQGAVNLEQAGMNIEEAPHFAPPPTGVARPEDWRTCVSVG